jgi:protein-tyrosine phosphatase
MRIGEEPVSTLGICFICSGNICRSPYAEVRMRQMLDEAGLGGVVTVTSAGTLGIEGEAAHPRSVEIAELRGTSLRGVLSRGVTVEIIATADLIVCMASEHVDELATRYPEATPRLRLLRSARTGIGGSEIPDPVGAMDDAYDVALSLIDDALVDLLSEIRTRVSVR